jgi:hypothetical protein
MTIFSLKKVGRRSIGKMKEDFHRKSGRMEERTIEISNIYNIVQVLFNK